MRAESSKVAGWRRGLGPRREADRGIARRPTMRPVNACFPNHQFGDSYSFDLKRIPVPKPGVWKTSPDHRCEPRTVANLSATPCGSSDLTRIGIEQDWDYRAVDKLSQWLILFSDNAIRMGPCQELGQPGQVSPTPPRPWRSMTPSTLLTKIGSSRRLLARPT